MCLISINSFQLTNRQASLGLKKVKVEKTLLSKNCPKVPACNHHAKYRTSDGSCNNLQKPLWGAANTQLQRILPPLYDDGSLLLILN